MAFTAISDLFEPITFGENVVNKTAEKVSVLTSGLIVPNKAYAPFTGLNSGRIIDLPYINDTDRTDVLHDEGLDSTPGKLTTGVQKVRKIMREKSWGFTDIGRALANEDPLGYLEDIVARYWASRIKATAVAVLGGVVASNLADDDDMVYKGAFTEDGLNATSDQLMGDFAIRGARLTSGESMDEYDGIIMHSVCAASLENKNLLNYDGVSSEVGRRVARWGELRVIVDDSVPVRAGTTSGYVYTSYLFRDGALAYNPCDVPKASEVEREAGKSGGRETLYSRNWWIMHPNGWTFTSSAVAANSPTNAELLTAGNWDRFTDRNNCGIAAVYTNG